MIKINDELLENVSTKAKKSQRKRKNHNFHENASDTLQRMLNAIEPETYVCPHKHENPDKIEVFILLKGKALVVEFDNFGNISDFVVLSHQSGNFAVEIKPKIYHSIISLETETVVYELKNGPYNVEDDKYFADWAPREGDFNCSDFNKKTVNKCLEKSV